MKRKAFSIMFAVVLALSFGLVTAVPVSAVDHYPDPPPAPQMEEISGLSVVTGDTWDVSTGIVTLVFDFYDADDDLRDLMIDWSLEPYTQDRKAQTNFLATEDMGIYPFVLTALEGVGIFPSYNVGEQKWTIIIDTNAAMTSDLFQYSIFKWVEAVDDPIFPGGRYDWYIEVRDLAGNKWGNMMDPPDYSHYVGYFHSIQSAIDDADVGDTIIVHTGEYSESVVISTDGITLRGEAGTILDGTGLTANGITLSGVSGVTIEGFDIRSYSGHGIYLLNADDNFVEENKVLGSGKQGIGLRDANDNFIGENEVSGSKHGILLRDANGNFVEKNEVSGSSKHGILLWDANGNSVEENEVSDSGEHGIYLLNANNNFVEENEVSDSVRYGISLIGGASNNEVKENEVSSSGTYDLHWDGSGSDNTWVDNEYDSSNLP